MALELIRDALGWCTLIIFGLLIFWFLFFRMGRDWTYGFHGKWFRLAAEEFDRVHYRGMLYFKLGIVLVQSGAVSGLANRRVAVRRRPQA